MTLPVVYVVVEPGGYDKDRYLGAFLGREVADRAAALLNIEAGDGDEPDETLRRYRVWTLPLGRVES